MAGKKSKFGFFLSEEADYQIAGELGIIRLSKPDEPLRYARHPLVYLVEAADDICYQMMDIEDAHKLKLLTHDETKGLYMQFFDEKRRKRIEEVCRIVTDVNEQIAYLRSSVIGALIKECTRVFTENEEKILTGEFEGTLIMHICSPLKEAYDNCSAIAFQRIYRSSDVLDIELAGFRVISTLIDLMINAVRSPEKRIHNYLSTAYPDSTMSTHLLYMENSSRAGLHIGHDRRICARPLPENQRQQSAGSIIKTLSDASTMNPVNFICT